ncbi:MAG: hypothetical protein JO321_12860 [Solirubrobacterales bacterium]|nr:hypothetical protein [Solirubrobacterales bacterium]MBV9167643.1 hypothetical protein [Solirubrobacterales bacterium]MBV9536293.1 hypothetical protein [Solirubrobacterales bacterium]
MSEQTTQIAALLHESGETHHLVYRIVDGEDPDWASWYADWLINLSELHHGRAARRVAGACRQRNASVSMDKTRE